MSQFDICRNTDSVTQKDTPYLLDIQSESMSVLSSRLVIPLRKVSDTGESAVKRIHLHIEVNNEDFIAYVSEMAAVHLGLLGSVEARSVSLRTELIAAVDLLITGF